MNEASREVLEGSLKRAKERLPSMGREIERTRVALSDLEKERVELEDSIRQVEEDLAAAEPVKP